MQRTTRYRRKQKQLQQIVNIICTCFYTQHILDKFNTLPFKSQVIAARKISARLKPAMLPFDDFN